MTEQEFIDLKKEINALEKIIASSEAKLESLDHEYQHLQDNFSGEYGKSLDDLNNIQDDLGRQILALETEIQKELDKIHAIR